MAGDTMASFLRRKKQILSGLDLDGSMSGTEGVTGPGRSQKFDETEHPSVADSREPALLQSKDKGESESLVFPPRLDKSLKGSVDRDLLQICSIINTNPSYVTTSCCSGRISVFQNGPKSPEGNSKKGGKLIYASHSPIEQAEVAVIVQRLRSGESHYQSKVKHDATHRPLNGEDAEGGSSPFPDHRDQPAPEALKYPRHDTFKVARHSGKPTVDLKVEPFVMHVECADLESARALLTAAVTCGLKHSGMSVAGPKRYIVAVRGSQRLEAPLGTCTTNAVALPSQTDLGSEKGTSRCELLVSLDYLNFMIDMCNDKMSLNLMQIRRFEAKLEESFRAVPAIQGSGRDLKEDLQAVKHFKNRIRKSRPTLRSDSGEHRASSKARRRESQFHPPQRSHPSSTALPNSEQRSTSEEVQKYPVLPHYILDSKNLDDRRRLDLWSCACALEYPFLCVYGGFARSKRTDCLLVYNLETSSWETKQAPSAPEGPGARVSASLLALGHGYTLLLFGRRGPSEPCSDAWLLDTRTWSWLPARPTCQAQKLPATGSSRLRPEAGLEKRAPPTEGKTTSDERNRCEVSPNGQINPLVEEDVAPSDHPAGRWRHAACVRQSAWTRTERGARGLAEVWIMGGVNGAQSVSDSVLIDLWRLTLHITEVEEPSRLVECQSLWTRTIGQGDCPPPLHSFAMVASSTHLFLFGGLRGDGINEAPIPLEEVYTFHIDSGVWRRQRPRCAVSISGEQSTSMDPLHNLCDNGNRLAPSPRFSHIALPVNSTQIKHLNNAGNADSCPPATHALVVGGCDGSQPLGDVWSLELDSLEWRFVGMLPNSNRSWRCRVGGAFSPASAELFLVGGGGICFTFGSHADPAIAVNLLPFFCETEETVLETPAALLMPRLEPGAAGKPNASMSPAAESEARLPRGPDQETVKGQGTDDRENGLSSQSSDTWLVVRNQNDVKWIKTVLEEQFIYDKGRKISSVPGTAVSQLASKLDLRQPCDSGVPEACLQRTAALTMIPVCRTFEIGAVLNKRHSVSVSGMTTEDELSSKLCFYTYSGEETKKQRVFSLDVAIAESLLEAAQELSASTVFLEKCSDLRASLLKSSNKRRKPSETLEPSRLKLPTLPRKFERLGNAVLLPAGSLQGLSAFLAEGETHVDGRRLEPSVWKHLAKRLKAETIGVQAPISGPKRQSQVQIIYGASGLVNHQENGVVYHFDVTKCMFASGNGTERARFVNLIRASKSAEPETVVDLFCGIGYFSLAALTCAGADKLKHLYACDWNQDALQFFEAALALNHVDPRRVTLNLCDSFQTPGQSYGECHSASTHADERALGPAPAFLVGKADRVSLGLIPSSEQAWSTALAVVNRERGAMLHVHGIGPMEFVEKPAHSLRVSCEAGRWNLISEPGVCATECDCKVSASSHFRSSETAYATIHGQKLYLGRDIGRDLKFAQHVLRRLAGLAVADFPSLFGSHSDCTWVFSLCHVERVKSYSPKQYHFVVDVSCRPESVLDGSS
ncbi:kelch repeat-containing protein [Toxoplasma gondii VEG]|uniref:tRNA(Phe) 7-[(3-amino-3-carboxypropyl)-4-demethylwyosine(37)-N(4)]-methyltransferase n=1 Tax=Toxoplasma gondii (strain ATCC 50861 / VEG) TaxID=432359 RepID=V5B549_TOXGV|nr:kelch repeat-containing protein [Toxoplasma gondii VEG]